MEESSDLIRWMYAQMEEQIRTILGTQIAVIETPRMKLFRLPSWKRADALYGIGFGTLEDVSKHLMGSGDEAPWVGVAVCQSDGTQPRSFCKPIADELNTVLGKAWPYPDDLSHSFNIWPLWRYLPVPENGDLEQWADQCIKLLVEMVIKLKDKLNEFASP